MAQHNFRAIAPKDPMIHGLWSIALYAKHSAQEPKAEYFSRRLPQNPIDYIFTPGTAESAEYSKLSIAYCPLQIAHCSLSMVKLLLIDYLLVVER